MNYTDYQKETLKKLQKTEREIFRYFVQLCEKHQITYYMFGGSLLGTVRHQGFIPWDDDIDVAMFRKDFEILEKILEEEKSEQYYLVSTQNEKDYFLYFPKLMLRGTKFKEWWAEQVHFETGIFIDIFIIDGLPENCIRQKLHILKTRFLSRMLAIATLKFQGYPKRIQLPVNILHTLFGWTHLSKEFLKRKTINALGKYDAKESGECFCVATVPYPPVWKIEDFIPGREGVFEGMTVQIPNHSDQLLKNFYGDYMKLPPENERYNHRTNEIDFGNCGEKK